MSERGGESGPGMEWAWTTTSSVRLRHPPPASAPQASRARALFPAPSDPTPPPPPPSSPAFDARAPQDLAARGGPEEQSAPWALEELRSEGPEVGPGEWERMAATFHGVLGEESLPERGRDVMLTASPRKAPPPAQPLRFAGGRDLREALEELPAPPGLGLVPGPLCEFCLNNARVRAGGDAWLSGSELAQCRHPRTDGRGRVLCRALRQLRCELCGATDDDAHTLRYCPLRRGLCPQPQPQTFPHHLDAADLRPSHNHPSHGHQGHGHHYPPMPRHGFF